jgi:hypothetical protein
MLASEFFQINAVEVGNFLLPWQKMAKIRLIFVISFSLTKRLILNQLIEGQILIVLIDTIGHALH